MDSAPLQSSNPGNPTAPPAGSPAAGWPAFLPFDPVRVVVAMGLGWKWALLAGLLLALPAAAAGWWHFSTSYTVGLQIIRRELPNSFRASDLGEAFKPRQFSVATVVAMMRSPSLLARVGAQARPRLTSRELLLSLTITPEKNTDLISVSLRTTSDPRATADLANQYAQQVVELTRTLQQQEASELDEFLRGQLARTDAEYAEVSQEMLRFSKEAGFYSAEKQVEAYLRELGEAESRLATARLEEDTARFRIAGIERELARQNPAALNLAEARQQLQALLVRYTDANPVVVEQRARVAALEEEARTRGSAAAEFQAGNNTVANSLYVDLVTLKAQLQALNAQARPLEERREAVRARLAGLPELAMKHARLASRQAALETTRTLLAGRVREAQLFSENAPSYYRLFAPAGPGDVVVSSRTHKIAIASLAAFALGAVLGLAGVGFLEALDDTLRSPGDVRRLTGTRVLAQLGDLAALDERALALWRFRTWSTVFRAVGEPGPRRLVAGILSARPGEGRTTWLRQLEAAAAERDFRTLLVSPEPAGPGAESIPLPDALADPGKVIARLEHGHPARIALVEPPGWTWDAGQRSRWVEALARWQTLPRLALLVELPPLEQLGSLLLAETLPQCLWLTRAGQVQQADIQPEVDTLRQGGIRLTGAFLNFLPPALARMPDLGRFGLVLAASLLLHTALPRVAAAESPASSPGETSVALATNTPALSATARGPQLAGWQQRLTLGPGDLVNLAVFGRKEFTRTEVPIGPDGRISYLNAQGIPAAGLTIDELRDRLTAEVAKTHRHARVIVTPAAFRSKRYFLLGTVIDRGAYPLDRPTTIIEAIARARGIATGLLEQNTVEIADLPRAFLVRHGQRMPVDFVRLFQQGDLSQNIALEPDDYLYFPSSVLNEVYVLGSIASPGTVGVTEHSSVVGIISTRGGFTDRAYRQRVLVVRGSLNQPETHVVNVADILRGKSPDFPLQPKDIVYVSDRPWARVEDLLDMAIKAFVTTSVSTWVNVNVRPVINNPILPVLQ